jgi:hypothetical protein
MGLEKAFSGRLSFSIRSRIDVIGLQDAADRDVGDQVAKIGQRPLEAIVIPARVFADHAQYQLHNLSRGGRTPDLLAALALFPLCSH